MALEGAGGDQPGLRGLARRGSGEQRRDEIMIAKAVVTKPLTVLQHGDDAGLAAVNDVRKGCCAPVGPAHS